MQLIKEKCEFRTLTHACTCSLPNSAIVLHCLSESGRYVNMKISKNHDHLVEDKLKNVIAVDKPANLVYDIFFPLAVLFVKILINL